MWARGPCQLVCKGHSPRGRSGRRRSANGDSHRQVAPMRPESLRATGMSPRGRAHQRLGLPWPAGISFHSWTIAPRWADSRRCQPCASTAGPRSTGRPGRFRIQLPGNRRCQGTIHVPSRWFSGPANAVVSGSPSTADEGTVTREPLARCSCASGTRSPVLCSAMVCRKGTMEEAAAVPPWHPGGLRRHPPAAARTAQHRHEGLTGGSTFSAEVKSCGGWIET